MYVKPSKCGVERKVDVPSSAPVLRHVFFARFKDGAPVEALAAEYGGLTSLIPEMRAFEWGRVRAEAADRRRTASSSLMSKFADETARDAYLAAPAHDAFAAKMFGFLENEKVVVFDFIETSPAATE
jgi:hypothetical protein